MEQLDEVERMPVKDKLFAVATINKDHSLFYKDEATLTDDELRKMDLVLYEHAILNGVQGLKMSVRVGRALKASLENPIIKKETLVTKFKDLVKDVLS